MQIWTSNEVNELVSLVAESYKFINEPLNNSKTKVTVGKKWEDIAEKINALGEGTPFSREKVKRKWLDLKSTSKKAVTMFNKQAAKSGQPGTNPVKTPTELQYKITSLMGTIYTKGVAGTELCDSSHASNTWLCRRIPKCNLWNQGILLSLKVYFRVLTLLLPCCQQVVRLRRHHQNG